MRDLDRGVASQTARAMARLRMSVPESRPLSGVSAARNTSTSPSRRSRSASRFPAESSARSMSRCPIPTAVVPAAVAAWTSRRPKNRPPPAPPPGPDSAACRARERGPCEITPAAALRARHGRGPRPPRRHGLTPKTDRPQRARAPPGNIRESERAELRPRRHDGEGVGPLAARQRVIGDRHARVPLRGRPHRRIERTQLAAGKLLDQRHRGRVPDRVRVLL